MAETIATAIANYAAEYFGADAIATYVAVYEAIPILQFIAVAYSYAENAQRQRRQAIAAHNASLQDRYLMVRSATEPRQIVLGRQRVSGPIAYVGSYGVDREHLVFVLALAGHECDAIETIYFDDEIVTLDGSGNVTAVARRDLFTITTGGATFTLSSDPASGSVAATATYGTTVVTLGVSVAGRAVTVSGATNGSTGTVNITYQPDPSPFFYQNGIDKTESITLNGSGTGSITLAQTPVAGSVTVTGYVGSGQDVVYYDLAAYTSVAGSVVTVTGWVGGASTWTVTYRYIASGSRARVRKYLGAAGQSADAGMIAALPGIWTSAHTMTSITYLVVELDFDPNAFSSGMPNISAVVRGAKLYDPRSATTVWSQNPALMCRYVTISPLLTRRTSADVNDTYIAAAATVCDTSSAYVVDGRTYTRALYTAGLTIKSGTRAQDALNDLTQAMAGRWVWTEGQVRVKAGGYVTPVQTITDRWLHNAQAVRYQARGNRVDVFNAVTGKFADEQRDYRQIDFPRVESSAYVTEDGGQVLETDMSLNAVTFVGQAQQVVAAKMRQARLGERIVLLCNMRAFAVEVMDTVYLTLSRWGMVAEAFEVVDTGFSLDGGILLTLERTDTSVFALGTSFAANPLPPNTRTPSPVQVPAVAGLTLTSGTSQLLRQSDGTIQPRLRVLWTVPTDAGVAGSGGGTEVRFGVASTAEDTWQSVLAERDQDRVYLTDVHDQARYLVKARHFNSLVQGRWTVPVLHLMAGKSAPPSNPASLTATQVPGGVLIAWALNVEADYLDTEIRSGASWAAGTLKWRGTADRYLLPWPAAGALTLWIAHRDTSKNYSATPVSVGLTVGTSILIDAAQINYGATTSITSATNGFNTPAAILSAYGFTTAFGGIYGVVPFTLTESTTVVITCVFDAQSPGSASAQLYGEFFIVVDNGSTKHAMRVVQSPERSAEPSTWAVTLEVVLTLAAGAHIAGAMLDGRSGFRLPPWLDATFGSDVTTKVEIIRR